MEHYSYDCWDAETETFYRKIEIMIHSYKTCMI